MTSFDGISCHRTAVVFVIMFWFLWIIKNFHIFMDFLITFLKSLCKSIWNQYRLYGCNKWICHNNRGSSSITPLPPFLRFWEPNAIFDRQNTSRWVISFQFRDIFKRVKLRPKPNFFNDIKQTAWSSWGT